MEYLCNPPHSRLIVTVVPATTRCMMLYYNAVTLVQAYTMPNIILECCACYLVVWVSNDDVQRSLPGATGALPFSWLPLNNILYFVICCSSRRFSCPFRRIAYYGSKKKKNTRTATFSPPINYFPSPSINVLKPRNQAYLFWLRFNEDALTHNVTQKLTWLPDILG